MRCFQRPPFSATLLPDERANLVSWVFLPFPPFTSLNVLHIMIRLLTTGNRFFSAAAAAAATATAAKPLIPSTSAAAAILSPPPPPLKDMWAAINVNYHECALFPDERGALLYVSLILKKRGYEDEFPMCPREMDTDALADVVASLEGEDKAWVVMPTYMGTEDEGEEEDT